MTPEQQAKLVRIVSERMRFRFCSSCDEKKGWMVERMVETRVYNEGLTLGGAAIVPLVMLTCVGCSSVQIYNAIHLGVVDEKTGKYKLD